MTATVRARLGIGGTLAARLRPYFARWARRRQGQDRLPATVHRGRIYILPTRGGMAYATLVFVMLLAGLNYSNSIAMMITFLLAGFGLIAMHLTHRNLAGLVLRDIATVDAFAGEHGQLLLTVEDFADSARIGIDCETAESPRVALDVPASGKGRADLALPLTKRGRLRIERIQLSTAFPFGLFRAWTYVHYEVALIAWPVPRGRHWSPPQASSGGNALSVHRAGDEEWAGLREYRDGDSPRQVAWRAFARGRGLLVKTYESPAAHHRMFDLNDVQGTNLEVRLEQLSAWIMAAHARGERYGLTLGSHVLDPGSGSQHRESCLRVLALFGEDAR